MSRIVKGDLEVDGTVYADTIRAKTYKNIPSPLVIASAHDATPLNVNSLNFVPLVSVQANVSKSLIMSTVIIDNTSGAKRTYTVRLTRDGNEIGNRYIYEITAGERFVDSFHWEDDTAAGLHTYQVEVASNSANNTQQAYDRRISVIGGA